MHLIPASVLSVALGLFLVYTTSPNTPKSCPATDDKTSLSGIFTLHAYLADLAFTLLIAFLILCQTHHKWIAAHQSFPYSYHMERNFGTKDFDFQIFVFEVFHVETFSRRIHSLNLIIEHYFWLVIVRGTFGDAGLVTLQLVLAAQVLSYGDTALAIAVMTTNSIFAPIFRTLMLDTENDIPTCTSVAAAKTGLLYAVTTRTLSHILEPLPPSLDDKQGGFAPSFGRRGWWLCLKDPGRAARLLLLGIISELGAGMPGRLFNVVVYKCMWRVGYRSRMLVDVEEAKRQAARVQRRGWRIRGITREMYAWADGTGPNAGLQEL